MMIDNDDPRTIRPVAIIIVGKAEINASGSFRISNQHWGNNLYRFRSEIINSLSAANNSLKRNFALIDLSLVEWSLWRIENAILTLTRAYKCKLWTNKLLEQTELCFGECLWKPKLQTTNAVASSPHGSKMATSQMRIKISNSKNSQRITFPDNAEIMRCLTPFSRPGQKRTIISLRRRRDLWN